jgi:hypothetical protein
MRTDAPTADDVASAMRLTATDSSLFTSDGTARSDSARRMGMLAIWDFEGGDTQRGLRLARRARELGVADPAFFLASLALVSLRRADEALLFVDDGLRRWPSSRLLWRQRAQVLHMLGRETDADSARAPGRCRGLELVGVVPSGARVAPHRRVTP